MTAAIRDMQHLQVGQGGQQGQLLHLSQEDPGDNDAINRATHYMSQWGCLITEIFVLMIMKSNEKSIKTMPKCSD